jgi:histidinol-phosphate aminotransferase
MSISRRDLFRTLGAGAAAGVASRSLHGMTMGAQSTAELPATQTPVLLNRNENAYGPSERVLAVLRESVTSGNRYSRTECDSLVLKIAAAHAVSPEQVILGPGLSGILRSVANVFLGPNKKLVQASPTFPALSQFARQTGAQVVDVHINKRYQHDLEAMLTAAGSSASLVYICNPNDPTATLTPRKDIEAFLHKLPPQTMVLIDEAYHHFVSPNGEYASFLDQRLDDPRVMVARTFSKAYGLAGMRVGYLIASRDTARRLDAEQLQADVSVVSAKAAVAALDDSEYLKLAIRRNADDRQEFLNHVNGYMLRALDSHANFVMLDPLRPPDQVVEHLKAHNILIGPLIPAMPRYVRVSLGTPADMDKFWAAWDLMPATGKMAM